MSSETKMKWATSIVGFSESDQMAKRGRASCKNLGAKHFPHMDRYPEMGDYWGIFRDKKGTIWCW